MKRRKFLRAGGLGSLAMVLGGGSLSGMSFGKKNKSKPNMIIMFIDDLGYGDIEGFGNKNLPYKTPNIKRLADEGMKCTEFYVPTPYCAPSRATILTGRYPFRHGMMQNPAPDQGLNFGLSSDEIMIPEMLKTEGYVSSCIGKWHLGHTSEFLPRKQGFDEYYGILYSNDMRPVQIVENEKVAEYPVIMSDVTKNYTKRSLDFIEKNSKSDTPFFLYLAHAMPHKPLAASEEFYTPETPDDLYHDVIRELDWSVGKIMNKLKELNIDEETLVIFLSDNGPWFGGDSGGLRGMKARTWDGGLKVPFIARYPKKIPKGNVSDSLLGSIDVFPTLMHLADVELPQDRIIDGQNIWPLLTGKNKKSPHGAILGMQGLELKFIRSGQWKLHVRPPHPLSNRNYDPLTWRDPRGPDGITIIAQHEQSNPSHHPGICTGDGPKEMMLFNLKKDPSEQHDVAAEFPEVVAKLKKIFDEYDKQVPEFKPHKALKKVHRVKAGNLEYEIQ